MSHIISFGTVVGERFKGLPSEPIKNLVKFHLILSVNMPPNSFLRKLKTGWVLEPFTTTCPKVMLNTEEISTALVNIIILNGIEALEVSPNVK
jgi:hypothetical protein